MSVEKMRDDQKTKAELLQEVETLRRRVSELEGSKLERKQAEEALRESEERYRSLTDDVLDSSKVGIFILGKSFEIVWVNQAMERYFGLRREEVIGKDKRRLIRRRIKDIFDDPETFVEKVFATYDNNTYIENFECHVLADGQREDRWLEHWSQPIGSGLFAGGRIEHYTDITERKQAEEKLRRDKQTLEDVTKSAGCGLLLVDNKLRVTSASPVAEEWFGPLAEIGGKSCYEVLGISTECCAGLDALHAGTMCRSKVFAKGVGEAEKYYYIVASPVKDESGNIEHVIEVIIDVTEHRRAEEALRDSEENYRLLVENQTDMVVKFDTDGTLLFVSPSYCKTFGKSQEELNGSKFMPLIHEEDRKKVAETLNKVYRPPYMGYVEERALTKDGWRWQEWLNTAVLNNEKKVEAIIGVGRDITERKRAEDVLRESEKKYKALFQGAAEGIIVADTETKEFKYVNPAICKMLGYTEEELKRLGVRDIHPKKDLQYIISEFEAQARGEKTLTSSVPCLRKDGTIMYVDISTAMVLIDERQCNVGFFTDITERKEAEEELLFKSTLLEAQSETSIDGILVVDSEGKSISFNKIFGRMWNIPQQILDTRDDEKMLQYVLSQLKDPDQFLERVKYLYARKNEKSRDEIQFRDGRVFDRYSSPLLDSNDKYHGRVWYFRDITERRRAEDALRESESKYRTLVENLPQKIFLKDRNSVYISCNDNLAVDLKIKSEEIAGKTDYDFFPEELAKKYRADDEKIMASGGIEDIEERYIQDGQEVVVHTVKTPVKDTQGNVIGILGIFWDITEIKQAEEELDLYREKMAHAEQLASLGTLSATLTHELNQPLTAIRLSIENSLAELETTSCPSSVIEDLKDGLTGVLDAASIVKRFSNLAGKSSGKIITEVNLKAVAERIVKLLKESARRARVSLHLKGMDKLPPIRSNEKDLEQLFFSLVENAIQAADGKKSHRLIISGGVKDEHIELRFADDCCGIAPKNLDKIFEPFFTTRPIGERTGMGLCIVERIVSGAGGKIRVESKAGKGSTFFVTLPISRGGRS